MVTDQRIERAESLVVPITYSSRLEDGKVEPSRLSLLAFDAACYEAFVQKAELIVIAGEQSYTKPSTTTGEALRRYTPTEVPPIAVLSNAQNRLINTAYQADALSRTTSHHQSITLVGWEFHRERVMQNISAHGISNARYVTADSIIEGLWQTAGLWQGDRSKMLHEFSVRYGFTVEWPHIMEHALVDFAEREKRTILGQRLGKSGWVYKFASKVLGSGRYDDISSDGEAIKERAN